MKQRLCVILGDIVGSRQLKDKENFRGILESACAQVNSKFENEIFTAFKILKGVDEIGGVLRSIQWSYEVIAQLSERIHPQTMRFVTVYDYVDSGLETNDVAKMSGDAFHRAAQMIEQLKHSKMPFLIFAGDRLVDVLLSGQVSLLLLMKFDWSDRLRAVVNQYEKLGDQQEAAAQLGITQQAVSDALRRARWREIGGLEKQLNESLSLYASRADLGNSKHD